MSPTKKMTDSEGECKHPVTALEDGTLHPLHTEGKHLKVSSALRRLIAKSIHLPQQSHIIGYVFAFV